MQNEPATPPASTTTPADRSAEFVPVRGATETSSAEGLLLTAYLLMWAAVFGLIWATWRRQRSIDDRLSRLEASVEAASRNGAAR